MVFSDKICFATHIPFISNSPMNKDLQFVNCKFFFRINFSIKGFRSKIPRMIQIVFSKQDTFKTTFIQNIRGLEGAKCFFFSDGKLDQACIISILKIFYCIQPTHLLCVSFHKSKNGAFCSFCTHIFQVCRGQIICVKRETFGILKNVS